MMIFTTVAFIDNPKSYAEKRECKDLTREEVKYNSEDHDDNRESKKDQIVSCVYLLYGILIFWPMSIPLQLGKRLMKILLAVPILYIIIDII